MEAAELFSNSTAECLAGGIASRHNSSLRQSLEFIPYSVHTVRVLVPLWLVLGVPGSLLSLAVWSSRRMRSSSSVYLCALAVLDAIFLLLQQLLWHLQEYYDVPMLHNAPMCYTFPVYSMWLQYLSPLLILAFTVERYIGICHPFSSDKLCTVRRAAVTTGCLSIGCLLLGLMQLQFYGYNAAARLCSEDERILTAGSLQNRLYSIWTKTTEVLFFAVAPLAILVFNLLVLAQVRRAARATPARHLQQRARKSQPTAATVTLLSVSFYQIGVMMPVSALLFASVGLASTDLEGLTCNLTDREVHERLRDGRLPQLRVYFSHAAATSIVNALAVSHYAVKFFVYLATGTLFRRELLRLLCPRRLAAAVGVATGGDVVGDGDGGAGSECALALPSRRTSEQRRRLRQSARAEVEAEAAVPSSPLNGFSPEEKPLLKCQRSWV